MAELALHDEMILIDGMTLIELQCRWSIAYGWYFWALSDWQDSVDLEGYALAIGLTL